MFSGSRWKGVSLQHLRGCPRAPTKGDRGGACPRQAHRPVLFFPRKIPTLMTEVSEMGSQEDTALVRRGYEAFITGDMETLREQFADDVVRHAAGTGDLAGYKNGPDAVLILPMSWPGRAILAPKVMTPPLSVDRHRTGVRPCRHPQNGMFSQVRNKRTVTGRAQSFVCGVCGYLTRRSMGPRSGSRTPGWSRNTDGKDTSASRDSPLKNGWLTPTARAAARIRIWSALWVLMPMMCAALHSAVTGAGTVHNLQWPVPCRPLLP